MSGVAGIFFRDNTPVRHAQLFGMGKALYHRGVDGIDYYCQGPVGLVYFRLNETPESILEEHPSWTNDSPFIVVFEGRLDNRQELYDNIGLMKPLSMICDSELALAAYYKWRRECVLRFIGDFIFVVWDKREQKLYCFRDHFGIKPFYFYKTRNLFAFSSEIKALHTLSEISQTVNEQRIADYFTGIVLDYTSTFFDNISRLAPSHYIEIHSDRDCIVKYYEVSPQGYLYRNEGEYVEAFRKIFVESIQARLRSVSTVGAYLSGGLDSSSICAVAAALLSEQLHGKLETFSGIFELKQECDERQYFDEIINRYSLDSYQCIVDQINPSIAFEKLMEVEDEPFWAPHVFMSYKLLEVANSRGIRVLLDGHDGDAAVSYGYNSVIESALSGDLLAVFRFYRRNNVTAVNSICKRVLLLYWNIFCSMLPVRLLGTRRHKEISLRLSVLDKTFVRKYSVKERLIEQFKYVPDFTDKESEYHRKNLIQPVHPYALEFMERVAIRKGVIIRYPFFDKRLIEFCLAVPGHLKLRSGLNRYIVRAALAEFLPRKVQHRKSKTDFTPSLMHAFIDNDNGWLRNQIEKLYLSKQAYINMEYLEFLRDVLRKGGKEIQLRDLSNALCFVSFFNWRQRYS